MMYKSLYKPSGNNVIKRCSVGGLYFSEALYAPKIRMPRHDHKLASFSIILKGGYTEMYERKVRDCIPSSIIFHPSEEIHAVDFGDSEVRILKIEIQPLMLNHVREHSVILDYPAVFHGGLPVSLALRLYNEFRRMNEVSPLAIEGLALEILAEASRSRLNKLERQPPVWLKQAQELLHARFSEVLTIDDIAKAVGVHPVHLARTFRQHYRCTIGEYVRHLRMEFASSQISTTDAPLYEIALMAGFSDQSHFSRTFKRFLGVTPAEYRKISRAR